MIYELQSITYREAKINILKYIYCRAIFKRLQITQSTLDNRWIIAQK